MASGYKDSMTAAECTYSTMKTFANYTIETKFPDVYSGLKPIHLRILWTLHRMQKQTPNLIKELSVSGEVVKMHPHGDSSINEAISVMAQPFSHVMPLVFSDSNVGSYVGDNPAGARYVDVGESEIAKHLFFTDVNLDILHMIPCESESGTEPAYLIPRIPTALAIKSFAIAVGFQSKITACSIPELCKMTKEYIKLRATVPNWQEKAKKTLVKYLLPDSPTASMLRNGDELVAAYKDGDYDRPAIIDGTMRVTKDSIIINTLPPDKPYKITYDVGKIAATNKSSWEYQNFQQMIDFAGDGKGTVEGQFSCDVRRGVNPFDVLTTLKQKLQFTGSLRPDRKYSDYHGNMTIETPFTLLDKWYNARYDIILGDLKQTLTALVDKERRLLALIIVRDHAKEVFDIHNNAKEETVIPALVKRFSLSRYQAKFVSGLTFGQITAKGKEALLSELENIKKQKAELQQKFHCIPDIMIDHIESFERKFIETKFKQGEMVYDLSRRCRIPEYIGCAIYKGNGHIMIEDEKEFDQIVKDFDPEDLEFKLFDRYGKLRSLGSEEDIPEGYTLPKYFKAESVDRYPASAKHTACIGSKGGLGVIHGLIPRQNDMRYTLPINNQFIAIYKNGNIALETINEKMIRKSVNSGPAIKDIVHVANGGTDVVVIHGSSSQPNVLLIERVDLSKGPVKLRRIVVGEWKILGVYPVDVKRIYLNLPKELRQRCTVRHLVIDDIGDITVTGKRLNCVFGRNTIKSDFEFVPLRRKSTIVQAKLITK